jgi:hypothetical protein
MAVWVRGALCLLLMAGPALSQTMDRSPRPLPNPVLAGVVLSVADAPPLPAGAAETAAGSLAGAGAMLSSLRPMPRPAAVSALTEAAAERQRPRGLLGGLLRPKERPEAAEPQKTALRGKPSKVPVQGKKGSVCGDPAIRGEVLAPVTSRVKGCGVPDPVRVTAVSGVRLSQPATIDCDTARALKTWVDKGLQPAFGRREVVELKIAAHYICRPRNNKRGAKISEHGRGKAIDIAGFVLSDGTQLSILRDYNRTIRKAHKAACGIFGTTLGPGSDGYHEDHLHFDTARHGNGPYCR